ncbi:hypothetical protein C8F01DRAFT_992099, partial [Mycena amicta]
PHLVVIDGLDECNSKVVRTRIIKIIFELLLARGLPHRFLICSRPEPHIREALDSLLASGHRGSYRHLVLDDSSIRIAIFVSISLQALQNFAIAFPPPGLAV